MRKSRDAKLWEFKSASPLETPWRGAPDFGMRSGEVRRGVPLTAAKRRDERTQPRGDRLLSLDLLTSAISVSKVEAL
jgi:hypothetical protein